MQVRKLVFLLSLLLIAPFCGTMAQAFEQLGEIFPSNERIAPLVPSTAPTPSALRTANTFPISITPTDGSIGIIAASNIEVNFNAAINPATVNNGSFAVKGENSGNMLGTFAFSNGNATITFTPHHAFSAGEMVNVYVTENILDMNGDGVLPIASKYYVDVAESEGFFGNLSNLSSWTYSFTAKPFDIDQDGDLDIACMGRGNPANGIQSKIVLYHNLGGSNGFGPPTYIDLGYGILGCGHSYGLEVGDLNGDGYGDLVAPTTANSICQGVLVLLNDGTDHFPTSSHYPTAPAPDQALLDDLNGDGALDIIVSGGGIAGAGTARVTVLLNNGNGTFAAGIPYPTASHTFGLSTGDIDDDGDMDILATNSGANNFSVLFNDGYGVFSAPTNYPTGFLPRDIVCADLNGDGLEDVVMSNQTNSNPGTLTIYYNQGGGIFGNRQDLICNGNTVGLAVADVDGDGDLDIGAANYLFGNVYSSRSLSVFHNTGGTFLRQDYDTFTSQPFDINFGDFNGDGTSDIVSCSNGQRISILYNILPNVVGNVFTDDNEDCVQNGAELPASNVLIYAIDQYANEYYTYTRQDGKYSFILPANRTYEVGLAKRQGNEASCAYGVGDHFVKTITPGTVAVAGDQIPLKSNCGATLGAYITLSPFCSSPACVHGPKRTPCPCETFTYTLQVNNTGNAAIPAGTVLSVDLPSFVKLCNYTPVLASPEIGLQPVTYSGGTLNTGYSCPGSNCGTPDEFGGTVNITTAQAIQGGNSAFITISLATANVPANCQELLFDAYFSLWAGNANCIANTQGNTYSDELCCSYDPNDKKVYPSDKFCQATDLEEPFYYTIRFQNTGSAPAQRVMVRDAIDSDLDMQSFRALATSHDLTKLKILPGNTVEWVFDGINLADSGSNMAASMGYINYMIYAKENTPEGSIIANKAAIYFDANPPVITNTTLNQISGDNSFPADFGYEQLFDCFRFTDPMLYSFYPSHIEPNASYSWSFGPDATPSSTNYTYTYASFAGNGLKTATLTVTLGHCSYSKTVQFVVNGTVPICHIAPANGNGSSNNLPSFVTLNIPINSLSQHLAHGDKCGPCSETKQAEVLVPEQSMQLSIAPNPAQSFARLDYAISASGKVEIRVLDQLGREVRKVFSGYCDGNGSLEMNLESLNPGVYFIELSDGTQRISQKLVIAK